MTRQRLVHLTTTDMSLDWLLRPQLLAFQESGFEVIAMSAPGPHVASLEAAGITHCAIPALSRSMAPGNDLKAFGQLYRAFRRLRPTIVHTHNPKPGVLGRIAARAAGVPVVVNTVHGLYALPEDRLTKRVMVYGAERVAAACSDLELLQNPEDLPVLRRLGVPHDRLTVLGNGIDLRRFDPTARDPATRQRLRDELGIAPHTVVIGAVGRLVWEKGYRAVFEAARRMTNADCAFVVVGPSEPDKAGALTESDREAAESMGVRFLGARLDMVDVYSMFDVYVLGSHREGYPRSAMEASAMGLPVVATDIRGCRQVVVDGATGSLVPVDDADRLTRALSRLVESSELRERQGQAARERALRHFDDRTVVNTTLRAYDRLLSTRDYEAVAAPSASA